MVRVSVPLKKCKLRLSILKLGNAIVNEQKEVCIHTFFV